MRKEQHLQHNKMRPWILFVLTFSVSLAWADVRIDEAHFPDKNFREFLYQEWYGKDSVITDKEFAGIKELDVCGKIIKDMKGIEYFTSLELLDCGINHFCTLNLSHNKKLRILDCGVVDELSTINISECSELEELDCWECNLTVLDVSRNTKLRELSFQGNNVSEINLLNCPKLENLNCGGYLLNQLSVTGCPMLKQLLCNNNHLEALDVSNNKELTIVACSQNMIKATAMRALVEGLCEIKTKEEHKLALFDCDGGEEENNVCTPEYVKTAWAKGWVVYYSDYGYWRPMRRWSDDDIHKMLGSKD